MIYVYTVTATLKLCDIPKNQQNLFYELCDNYNSEAFNELFYYGCIENEYGFIATYDTKFIPNFTNNTYYIEYSILHNKSSFIKEFSEMYRDDIFTDIFDLDAGSFYELMENNNIKFDKNQSVINIKYKLRRVSINKKDKINKEIVEENDKYDLYLKNKNNGIIISELVRKF
jgi:hypothetical protein